jgi:hypothetical protein
MASSTDRRLEGRWKMSIGVGIFLMVLGAIMAFAMKVTNPGINVNALGIILLLIGLVVVLYSLLFWRNLSPWVGAESLSAAARWSRSDRSRWSRSAPSTTVFPSFLKTRNAAGLVQTASLYGGNRCIS